MIYKFSEYNRKSFYEENGVIFVCGSHPMFNSIVIDNARDACKGSLEFDENALMEAMSEFGDTSSGDTRQSLSFDEFMDYVKTPSLVGRWFSSLDYTMLTKKQVERLWNYIRKPNLNGLMVINVSNFKQVIALRKNNVINRSKLIAMINMEYPGREELKSITRGMFLERGMEVDNRGLDFFLMRMSNYYDDYAKIIDQIQVDMGDKKKITMDDLSVSMKGIENYMFDDFVMALTKPVSRLDIVPRRKIYRMLRSLLDNMEPKDIVNRLYRQVQELILYREAITDGSIPILVRYSIQEAKDALGEKHQLYNTNAYKFKKMAFLASKTSLRDWFYILEILSNVDGYKRENYLKVILAVIHRHVVSNDRLMNDIGVKDTLSEQLYFLNAANYPEYIESAVESLIADEKLMAQLEKEKEDKQKALEKAEAARRKKEVQQKAKEKARAEVKAKKQAEKEANKTLQQQKELVAKLLAASDGEDKILYLSEDEVE